MPESNPYAKEYPKKHPMVERYDTKQRVDGPNTRLQTRAHGRYLEYGLMPPGYATSHAKYAKWLRTHGKTGGRTRRHRKSRSTRRR